MPTNPGSTIVVKPKWMLRSKTIIGTALMAAAALAPVLTAFTGIDLTPVIAGAENLVDPILSGVAGIIGAWLVVSDRIKGIFQQPISVTPNASPVVVTVPAAVLASPAEARAAEVKKNFNL